MIYPNNLKAQISVGALDEKVTLRIKGTETKNSLGEVVSFTYSDFPMWAYVENDSAEENLIENKETVLDFRTLILRYKVCAEKDLIIYNGAIYEIKRIELMGRRRYMKLKIKRVN